MSTPSDAARTARASRSGPPLEYPIEAPPALGTAVPLHAGVHWVRMPIPGSLRHINLWLLEDGDGWTLVDTGMNVPECRAAWDGPLHDYLRGRPLRRIVCTHHHPDHAGLAHTLQARHGARVAMSAAEYAVMQRLAEGLDDPATRERRIAAYQAEGLPASAEMLPFFTAVNYYRATSGVPAPIEFVADGDVLAIGDQRWTAIEVRGHSDGQLVFANEAASLLIAGDQILPRITSNIGIYPERADRDPVASYLQSFLRLEPLARDVLVLPSHGDAFRGLHARIGYLRTHHAQTLERLHAAMDAPLTAAELAERMFPIPLDGLNRMLAVGETLAHVAHLIALGRATQVDAPASPHRYARLGG